MSILDVLAGVLTAFFGWCGGRGDDWWVNHKWFPRWLCQSWVRDWMIPITCIGVLLIYGVVSWWLVAFFVLTLGALSTYWDDLFGWDNFFFHGFMIGVASFPVAIVTGQWSLYFIRIAILTVWMGLWSGICKDADVEESGRYFIVGITTFMLA